MKINFYVLSKLLASTSSLITAGYFMFGLSILALMHLQECSQLNIFILMLWIFLLIGIHHYIYIRVKFDSDLLIMMHTEAEHQSLQKSTFELDQSLILFKLMPSAKTDRDWQIRFKGCLKLYKIQIFILVLQAVSLFCVLMIHKL